MSAQIIRFDLSEAGGTLEVRVVTDGSTGVDSVVAWPRILLPNDPASGFQEATVEEASDFDLHRVSDAADERDVFEGQADVSGWAAGTYRIEVAGVLSDDWLEVEQPEDEAPPSQLLDVTADEQARAAGVIDATYVSRPIMIRAIEGISTRGRLGYYGEQDLLYVPNVRHAVPISDQVILIQFWFDMGAGEQMAWWAKTSGPKDGRRASKDGEDAQATARMGGWLRSFANSKDHLPAEVFRLPSNKIKVVNGNMRLDYDFMVVIVDKDEETVTARAEALNRVHQWAEAQSSDRYETRLTFARAARLLVDNFVTSEGKADERCFFFADHFSAGSDGMRYPVAFLPLKARGARYGRTISLLKKGMRVKGGKKLSFLDTLNNLGEGLEKEDIFSANHWHLALSNKDQRAQVLIDNVVTYFRQHPEQLHELRGITTINFLHDLAYSIMLLERGRFFAQIDGELEGMSSQDMKKRIAAHQEIARKAEVAFSMFVCGIYEYMRLHVAYPLLSKTLKARSSFLKEALADDERIGRIAANLVLKYHLARARTEPGRRARLKQNFAAQLLPLGLRQGPAELAVEALDDEVTKHDIDRAEGLERLRVIIAGSDFSVHLKGSLRSYLRAHMKEARQIVASKHDQIYSETYFDLYKSHNLLGKYKLACKQAYEALRITRLDPNAHPKARYDPPGKDQLRRWPFLDFAIHAGGKNFEARDDDLELALKIFMTTFSLGCGAALGYSGLSEVIANAAEGVTKALLELLKDASNAELLWEDAMAGLAEPSEAKAAQAQARINFALNLLDTGVGAYTSAKEMENPLTWTSADGALGKFTPGGSAGDWTEEALSGSLTGKANKQVGQALRELVVKASDESTKAFVGDVLSRAKADGIKTLSSRDLLEHVALTIALYEATGDKEAAAKYAGQVLEPLEDLKKALELANKSRR